MSRPTLYVWAMNVVGIVVVLHSVVSLVRNPLSPGWLVLAILALIGGATVLRMQAVPASFSIGDTFSFAALFVYGPEAATVTVALDTLAISSRIGGSASRVLFNTAAPALAMWCAGGLVFHVVGVPLPVHAPGPLTVFGSAGAAVAISFLLGSWFVATTVALHQHTAIFAVWRKHFAPLWTGPAAGGYVGALVAFLFDRLGLAALLSLMPIPVIMYYALRSSLGRVEDQLRHLLEMKGMYHATVEAFATAVDAKDQVTAGHTRRVQADCAALAQEFGISDESTLRALEAAALLHDVGKIGIPEHILNKPGKLSTEEFAIMKGHVVIGTEILSGITFPFPVVPIVAAHHESWDGTGYPAGLRGEEIPLAARILTVVDCFDALTSDRPYRSAMSHADAFDILRERRGTMYDPQVVDRFITLRSRFSPSADAAYAASAAAVSPDPSRR